MELRLVAPRDTVARDIQFAAAALAGGLLLLVLRMYASSTASARPPALFLPSLIAVGAALALRRRAPGTGLALGLAGLAVDVALGGSIGTILIFTQVLYEVCVHGSPGLRRWALRTSVAVTIGGTAAAMALTRSWAGATVGVLCALVLVLPVLTAYTVVQYRTEAIAERLRAEQTARLAELDRRQAVSAERTRMARDLHDVIANHLGAVALHASALLTRPDLDRATVVGSVRVIRENSVRGLAEMRRMVQLLRDPGSAEDASAALARLSDVDRLVAEARSAGLAAELTVTGPPRPLPADVDLAAYRIVQESLTNALKHGDGRVRVAVDYRPDAVAVTVDNPLSGGGAAVPGAGAGVLGMRERADLVGGRATAGPGGPGWRVRAELPTADR